MTRTIAFFALLATVAGVAAAQSDCTTAVPLLPGLNAGSTVGFPAQAPPIASCVNGGSASWWFTVSSAVAGSATFTMCSGGGSATYDSALAIYTGSCGSLSLAACNDDTCGLVSEVVFPMAACTTYYVRVHGFGGGTGAFNLNYIPPAGSALALSMSSTNGDLVIGNTGGNPGDLYFSAFSFDSANSTAPAAGWWFGLHIDLQDLVTEHNVGVPPFKGNLDAGGASLWSVPPGSVSPAAGIQVWGVTATFDTVNGYFVARSCIASTILTN